MGAAGFAPRQFQYQLAPHCRGKLITPIGGEESRLHARWSHKAALPLPTGIIATSKALTRFISENNLPQTPTQAR